ncbi:MAG: D-proline reductase (dithiol) PrdB, partial [Gammaproteobacteria bacterium]
MCHQCVSLTARHLEQAGIPTVIIGSARDIVEQCAVPRFLFVDFPLGNPCGKPRDVNMQRDIIGQALNLLERAWEPQTTVQTRHVWNADNDTGWRDNFMPVDDSNRGALASKERGDLSSQLLLRFPAQVLV